jgi:hypothetical protein
MNEETFITVLIREYGDKALAAFFAIVFIISGALAFIDSVKANGILQAIINIGKRLKP